MQPCVPPQVLGELPHHGAYRVPRRQELQSKARGQILPSFYGPSPTTMRISVKEVCVHPQPESLEDGTCAVLASCAPMPIHDCHQFGSATQNLRPRLKVVQKKVAQLVGNSESSIGQ